jgi:hypothetical protein
MGCVHKNSPQKLWLPSENGIIRKHSYCCNCGIVKTSSNGKRLGYFINALSALERYLTSKGLRFSKVQKRLIVKKLEEFEIDDAYGYSFKMQKEIFTHVVRQFINLRAEIIESFL